MDKAAALEILNFLGASRQIPVKRDWSVSQLQYGDIHFGMHGDDAFLRQHFKKRLAAGLKGTYVDIGAFHPALISNTYLFYLMGWRGLAVDANPAYAPVWKKVRPEDILVNVAIADVAGTAYFWKHKDNEGMTRVTRTNVSPGGDFDPTPAVAPAERLDVLLQRHIGERDIQLMTLDIEGAEMMALTSSDWERWRPETIIMEACDLDVMAPLNTETVAFLVAREYRIEAKFGANVVLVDARPRRK
jgi:FkbM family methyltransferase